MGCPAGSLDPARRGPARRAIADYEIAPQVGYHQRHAEQIDLLDQRLETIGIDAVPRDLGRLGRDHDRDGDRRRSSSNQYGNWFTLVSAGFPALGTAVFGIRFQADFGGDALRSLATANTLGRSTRNCASDVAVSRAADLAEQAARVMLSDLDEWRLVNQQRDLSVG